MISKRDVVDLSNRLAGLGYCPGGAGNVSARSGESLLITRTGADLSRVDVEDVIECDVDWVNRRLIAGGESASKEVPMHIAMHARNPGKNGFIGHVHSSAGTAVSCLAPFSSVSSIPPLTPYFVLKVGNVPMVKYAPPGSIEQSDEIYMLPSDVTTVLLANHGLSSFGETASVVIDRLREAEITAGVWLRVRNQPGVQIIDGDMGLSLPDEPARQQEDSPYVSG